MHNHGCFDHVYFSSHAHLLQDKILFVHVITTRTTSKYIRVCRTSAAVQNKQKYYTVVTIETHPIPDMARITRRTASLLDAIVFPRLINTLDILKLLRQINYGKLCGCCGVLRGFSTSNSYSWCGTR